MLELIAAILVLYWVESLAWVPADSRAVLLRCGRSLAYKREGLRWLALWPPDPGLVASPPYVEVGATRIWATLSLVRFSNAHEIMGSRSLELGPRSEVEALGSVVRIDGRPFLRLPSRDHADELAQWLSGLRGLDAAGRRAAARERLAASLSLGDLDRELARSARAVRVSAGLAVAGLALLLLAPLAMLYFGPGAARPRVGIAALALWAALLAAAWQAHRSLHPAARYARFELLFTAALFPPELLRLPALLRRRSLVRFQPLVFAARFAPRGRFLELAQEELGRLAYPAWRRFEEASAPEAAERRAFLADARAELIALAARIGIPESELLAPRRAVDPGAVAYCPRCLREYTRLAALCSGCGIESVPCAPAPSGAAGQ